MDVQFDESTGIYRRWHRRASTPESMRTLLTAFTEASSEGHRLDDTEAAIEHALSADNPGGHIVHKDPRCKAEYVRDLKSARASCRAIRMMLADGDIESVINEAILLGTIVERAGVRAHEANAARGAKSLADAGKGHQQTHGTPEAKRRRWAKYMRDWETVHAEYPNWGVGRIDDKVARMQDHRCCAKTVERARQRKET